MYSQHPIYHRLLKPEASPCPGEQRTALRGWSIWPGSDECKGRTGTGCRTPEILWRGFVCRWSQSRWCEGCSLHKDTSLRSEGLTSSHALFAWAGLLQPSNNVQRHHLACFLGGLLAAGSSGCVAIWLHLIVKFLEATLELTDDSFPWALLQAVKIY